ncbi:MAG: hypothetical protein VYD53_06890, partial [Pseudomonadota bacterium]|nr:hypothetical protein [Pseudomonadota bacterium]
MREVFKAFLTTRTAAALSAALLLGGCGGGGGDSGGSTVTPSPGTPTPGFTEVEPALTADSLRLFGELDASVGASVGFVVLSNDSQPLDTIDWQQTSGPAVDLLAAHTQAVGFDIPAAGTYEFTVMTTTTNGQQRSLNFTLNAEATTEDNQANIRLDHMATERGRVSLRVDSPTAKIITDAQWEQLAGPEAEDIVYQEDSTGGPLQSAFFAAPEVTQDEVMEFQVTLTFDDGATASDTVLVGINDAPVSSNGIFTQNDMFLTTDLIPYRADTPWADGLKECVYTNLLVNSCTFNELPLIGMQTSNPTIETILDKTLVSHPWMGDRFAEFMQNSATSADMLNLLRGVTAVVISYDVRPSFYWVRTGAIYLDARNFWRTPEERDTLNTAPDYRSDFGNDLQFGIYWRYVKNNSYYYPQASLAASSRNSRDPEQLEAALAWLMYHELAHANDFFPPTSWVSIADSQTPLSFFQNNAPQSTLLYNQYPLSSSVLDALADVSFGGETATTAQRNYTASEAADEFSADTAPAY